MVILQLKKIMVNSSASSTLNNSVSSPLHAVSAATATSTTCFETSSNCKSSTPFLDSFSSTSMISSNELFKERLDLKKKKQLSLNSYQPSTPSPTLNVQLTPTTPTTPHSPSHLAHSHSPRNGKQPRSRMQTTGINLKEKVIEEIPSVFDVCFASDLKKESSTTTSVLERDELKHIQDALLAEYCKLRPVTVQVDREQRADKTTVCSMKPIISITLQLPPHANRTKRN